MTTIKTDLSKLVELEKKARMPFSESCTFLEMKDLGEKHMFLVMMAGGFAETCAGLKVTVSFVSEPGIPFLAAYNKTGKKEGLIIFNLAKLDDEFWDKKARQLEVIVHELGHHWGGHLDHTYHEAICRIAGNAAAASNIDWGAV